MFQIFFNRNAFRLAWLYIFTLTKPITCRKIVNCYYKSTKSLPIQTTDRFYYEDTNHILLRFLFLHASCHSELSNKCAPFPWKICHIFIGIN